MIVLALKKPVGRAGLTMYGALGWICADGTQPDAPEGLVNITIKQVVVGNWFWKGLALSNNTWQMIWWTICLLPPVGRSKQNQENLSVSYFSLFSKNFSSSDLTDAIAASTLNSLTACCRFSDQSSHTKPKPSSGQDVDWSEQCWFGHKCITWRQMDLLFDLIIQLESRCHAK